MYELKISEVETRSEPTRKHKFNDGGIPREFVVKEAL